MNPISLELTKWRALFVTGLLLALLALAAGAGWTVAGWHHEGEHQRELRTLDGQIAGLRAALAEQSAKVDAAKAASDAAEDRRKLAEQYAARALDGLGKRADALASSKAADCAGLLREQWGAWK